MPLISKSAGLSHFLKEMFLSFFSIDILFYLFIILIHAASQMQQWARNVPFDIKKKKKTGHSWFFSLGSRDVLVSPSFQTQLLMLTAMFPISHHWNIWKSRAHDTGHGSYDRVNSANLFGHFCCNSTKATSSQHANFNTNDRNLFGILRFLINLFS